MKPIIGITVGVSSDGEYRISRMYCDKVAKAGGIPVIMPPTSEPNAASVICGGIIFSGGGDISPSLCGISDYDPVYLDTPSPERDRYELALARLAYRNNIPTLGICRGIQIINTALGGTLYFHMDGHVQKQDKDQPSHTVSIKRDSLLSKLVSADMLEVNSFHHQAVNVLAPGLDITATAKDGNIEAVEASDKSFFLGVQWHPEHMEGHACDVLFAALCTAASQKQRRDGA